MQQTTELNWNEPWLYRAVIEQIQEAIIVVDADEIIRIWNPGAEAMFGHLAADMLGRNLDAIIPERLRAPHSQGFRRAVETGQTKYAGQVMTTRAVHRNGSNIYVDLSFVLLRDNDNQLIGVSAVARDCTERYLAERAARAAKPA